MSASARSNSKAGSTKTGFFKSLFGGHKAKSRDVVPLYIPLTMKMEKDAEQNVEAMWNQVLEKRLGPLLLLQAADRYLEKISPLQLEYEQRNRISNIVLSEVVAAITTLFSRFFQHGGGIPETREQRETISAAVHVIGQLAINYKLLFRHDWSESDQGHATRERTLLTALRIFECARLEQLLVAFRYQKLSLHTWRDINHLFFSLRGEWDTKANYPLKATWTVDDGASKVELFPAVANLEQLYLALQLTGLLDVISWPVHLAYRVGGYLRAIDEPFIKDDKGGDGLPAGHCIVYSDQGGPPRFNRARNQGGESLLIDLNPILRRATQDRAALMSAAKAGSAAAALQEIPERERIAFLDLLLYRVQPRQRNEPRQRVFAARHARVYGGFDLVYRLFSDINHHEGVREEIQEDRRFWDSLAQHTNIVADGQEGVAEPRWVIADEGAGGIQLNVREGEYGLPLYVGRLVAYSDSTEGLAASRLGYVVRLQRIDDDEVELAIARVRGEIRAGAVQDQDSAEERLMPVLLIRGQDGNLQLLCDNKFGLITGSRVMVMYGGRRHSGALGKVIIAQADFSVFELHTPESTL